MIEEKLEAWLTANPTEGGYLRVLARAAIDELKRLRETNASIMASFNQLAAVGCVNAHEAVEEIKRLRGIVDPLKTADGIQITKGMTLYSYGVGWKYRVEDFIVSLWDFRRKTINYKYPSVMYSTREAAEAAAKAGVK